ncbi:MAG: AtpZ/AtpI family protein [Candidatus Devosia phytovorans]|uniref:ATP synthase protein I n=1 Tax=Candidatus Devosia phytovorans TaxID=3121372 RepID=A0AAJ5VRX3_9HYPH|nr:AtpZ/AtpI family protein [Devosia sp.]WEK03061.1 MAG: AtpZ/AtpI family protein [Devosia sp.]
MSKPQDTEGRPDSARGVTQDLASRIASAKRDRLIEERKASPDNSEAMAGYARGMRIATEFIAAIVVGCILGYLVDLGLGSSPWGLLIGMLMGFAAGILNVTRVVTQMNAASPPPTGSDKDKVVADENDK